jgi:16S rRNA (uracil1498-N3)-methyltransferase
VSDASDLARRAAAHVFVTDLAAPELTDDDAHHLGRVLRLRDGEHVTASDGAGSVALCTWSGGRLVPASEPLSDPAPEPVLCVGFALTKGDKPEWTVQRLTELGIDVISPFVAAHSIVRWDDEKVARNVERMRRVAREAAMQSRRSRLPQVRTIVPFSQVVADAHPGSVALAEPGGGALFEQHTTVLVGPEGGWTEGELGAVNDHVALGGTVLRAETAAVVAGSLLSAARVQIVHLNAKSGLSARTL